MIKRPFFWWLVFAVAVSTYELTFGTHIGLWSIPLVWVGVPVAFLIIVFAYVLILAAFIMWSYGFSYSVALDVVRQAHK